MKKVWTNILVLVILASFISVIADDTAIPATPAPETKYVVKFNSFTIGDLKTAVEGTFDVELDNAAQVTELANIVGNSKGTFSKTFEVTPAQKELLDRAVVSRASLREKLSSTTQVKGKDGNWVTATKDASGNWVGKVKDKSGKEVDATLKDGEWVDASGNKVELTQVSFLDGSGSLNSNGGSGYCDACAGFCATA